MNAAERYGGKTEIISVLNDTVLLIGVRAMNEVERLQGDVNLLRAEVATLTRRVEVVESRLK